MKTPKQPKNNLKHLIIFSLIISILLGLIYKKNHKYINKRIYTISHPKSYLGPGTRMTSNKGEKPFLKSHIKKYELHGIDISKHQGDIDWELVKHPDTTKNIDFVFIRATVGTRQDKLFNKNWKNATNKKFNTGAYHYYWANTNSTKQAQNFIKTVTLKKGDLPPVLDIEKLPKLQSKINWRKGIKNWIALVEKHYGVKPIIYTGDSFYKHHLKPDPFFKDYSRLWIANYNNIKQPKSKWHFWQYSDKVKIAGINELVDVNVFKNNATSFNELLKK